MEPSSTKHFADSRTSWKNLTRWQKWLVGLVLAVLVYAIVGFLVAPLIAKPIARKVIADQVGMEAQIGKIRLNPFALSVTVEDFAAAPAGQTNWVTLKRLYANAQISSLFGRDYVLKEVSLDLPGLDVVWEESGQINWQTVLDNLPESSSDEPFEIPGVRVDRLSVSNAFVRWRDNYLATGFGAAVDDVDLVLTNFHTLRTNTFELGARVDSDSADQTARVTGEFAVVPAMGEVEVAVNSFVLGRYADYLPGWTPLQIEGGEVASTLAASARFADGVFSASVSDANVEVRDISLISTESDDPVVVVDVANVDGFRADLSSRSAALEDLSVNGVRLLAARLESGEIDWLQRLNVVLDHLPEPAATHAEPSVPWSWSVGRIAATNANVTVNDQAMGEPVVLTVTNASLVVTGLTPDFSRPLPIEVGFSLATGGSGTVVGKLTPIPLAAEVAVNVDELFFPVGQPYVHDTLRLKLRDGVVSVDGDVRASLDETNGFKIFFLGDMHAADIAVDEDGGAPFATVREVRIDTLEIDWPIDDLKVKEMFVDAPTATLYIREDGSANVEEMVSPSVMEQIAEQIQSTWELLQFEVTSLAVTNGYVRMEDHSVDPVMEAGVTNAYVSLVGLSPMATRPAVLEAGGTVLPSGPVAVLATIDTGSTNVAATVAVNMQLVNLPPGSAYAGKFAGYLIDSGNVSADLKYTINGRKVEGENRIVVREFEFGEKRESDEALNLPVKLGVSLLKDINGVIDLDVPVEGDLSDPEFRLGKVIWSTIGNILQKAVTAPFKLLGGLVGAGEDEDLSSVAFVPGEATLSSDEGSKIAKLAQALEARPALGLEIVGSYDPVSDGAVLRQNQLDEALLSLKEQIPEDAELQQLARTFRNPMEPTREELLTAMYVRVFEVEYEVPVKPPPDLIARGAVESRTTREIEQAINSGPSANPPDRVDQATSEIVRIEEPVPVLPELPSVGEMEARLVEQLAVDEEALKRLASQRAESVRRFLETQAGIPADRLTIAQELSGEEPARPEPRVFLGIF